MKELVKEDEAQASNLRAKCAKGYEKGEINLPSPCRNTQREYHRYWGWGSWATVPGGVAFYPDETRCNGCNADCNFNLSMPSQTG